MARGRNKRKIPVWKERMIRALTDSGHGSTEIAKALNLSRNTVYLYQNPGKYQAKLTYVRGYEKDKKRDLWELESE